jgi:hypothetical protein
MIGVKNSTTGLIVLSHALLGKCPPAAGMAALSSQQDLGQLRALADSHHVTQRSFPVLQQIAEAESHTYLVEWISTVLEQERARIGAALSFLAPICEALEAVGKVIVIKSLDHWPDLGSDLDLFTNADSSDVIAIMKERFKAQVAERSWGDKLANKWNFALPGLPELVEVHVGRLGQTGEQGGITDSLIARTRPISFGSLTFQVPAAEDRLMISTLQRMYRHFYIRLCDIVDNTQLVEHESVDYGYLKSLARSGGLWAGVATYLAIVSDYVRLFRGEGLPLPTLVTSASRFGGDQVFFRRNFLRIPLLPHSLRLYASQLTGLLLKGEISNTLRLSLLPGLATAAAIELKLTGSDKGIW